ncbi:FAD dependent oxidoreductase [Legionella quinlivanii DSM 21216]|uniref:FAD-dependent oxidoreductase n=1 Tax=Legionella quinlivanii TaxID=45073 RepID=UPI00089ED38E|nr:FAD-dependent oxidoreductase [Legionella quinlivanii]SEG40547.1 FAD dependent oxidoreductase [Legionella quinlivanii DSM 21216]
MGGIYPKQKLAIIGGGIVAAMEAYFAYLDAKKTGESIRITIHEKNKTLSETTTAHIVPSLTPDEILSVVPRGQELVKKLQLKFNQPGGIRVDDVAGVNESIVTEQFIRQVQQYSNDEEGHQIRTKALLELGKMSMNLWQYIYDNADSKLKNILEESNFNPCREPKTENGNLHDGYRIDLIYNIPNAKNKANLMRNDYQELGYASCKLLSPKEVMEKDPFLTDFCKTNSIIGEFGELQWKDDAVALWRPGGCIDTQIFLPKFYAYLKEVMGTYTNESGESKDCFQLRLDRNVTDVTYSPTNNSINGLRFFGRDQKTQKHQYEHSDYVFCPGESVGTLKKLGFDEPAYSGFAGASLMLNIPLSKELLEKYKNFNHCMEVHQEGVVLAWQGRVRGDKIFIGVAGTKAFYSDQKPQKDQDFAKNRNLLQLNMINDVLPEFISIALGRETKGQQLTIEDLEQLEQTKIAERWVGTRAVAYDGFPTLGMISNSNGKVPNARCTTHLGSGGASFSPASVVISRSIFNKQPKVDDLTHDVLMFGNASRHP